MPHACTVCNHFPVPDGDGVDCPHCHRKQYNPQCPYCGHVVPTVMRGTQMHCGYCQRVRGPITATGSGATFDLEGKGSKVGGTVAKVFGWLSIGGSLLTAMVLYFVLGWIFRLGHNASAFPAVFSAFVAVIGTLFGVMLVRSGGKLQEKGDEKERAAQEKKILQLATTRHGMVSAVEAAATLNIPVAQADALLTSIARDSPERVNVEVDAAGVIQYVFRDLPAVAAPKAKPVQVPTTGVRVDAAAAAPVQAAATTEEAERDAIRAQIDQEFEQMRARHKR